MNHQISLLFPSPTDIATIIHLIFLGGQTASHSGLHRQLRIDHHPPGPLAPPPHLFERRTPRFCSLPFTHTELSLHLAATAVATGCKISFESLWRSVKALAVALSAPPLSIRKSNVVLLSPNSLHFPIVSLAIMSLGAIFTITNPLNTTAEIAKQLDDSAIVLAFTTPHLLPKLLPFALPVVLTDCRPPVVSDSRVIATIDEL